MKKYFLFIYILLINNYSYSTNINFTDLIPLKNNEASIRLVKTNEGLKPKQKSTPPAFYFSKNIFKNTSTTFKQNTLFFAIGDILDEDFESATGWGFTNDTIGNKWVIGTAVHNGGKKSLYISKDDGVTNSFNDSLATVIHAYKNITIPATTGEIGISFDWKCLGEGINPKKDYFNLWIVPDGYVPKKGNKIGTFTYERVLLGSFNSNGSTFKNEFISFDTHTLKGKKFKILFEWISNNTGGWQPPAAIDNLTISSLKYTSPSNIVIEDITSDSALMKWDASKIPPVGYEVYYSKDSIPPTKTTTPSKSGISTTSTTLDSLDHTSTYYVWIRPDCETEKCPWSKVYIFRSDCDILNIPFKEDFDPDSDTFECWKIVNGNKDNTYWGRIFFPSTPDNGMMRYRTYDKTNTITSDDWLISPTFKMNGSYRVKYQLATPDEGNNGLEVLWSKDGKAPADFKHTLVPKKKYPGIDYIFREKIAIIYNVVGNVNIAWHAYTTGVNNINIDNVIIEKVTNCPEPVDLEITDIKKNQATISWEDDFGAKNWEYFIHEGGKGAPVASGISTNKKEIVLTKDNSGSNLKPNTAYEFYVRVKCADGKFSDWSAPLKFRTECDVYTVPFSEGFNSDSNDIYCWTIIDGNEDKLRWNTHSPGAFEGDQAMLLVNYDQFATIEHDDWLISPTIKMNGTYRLKYHHKATSTTVKNNSFEVLLSKNGKETKEFKQVVIPEKNYSNKDYKENKVILHNIVGDINIAWHAKGKGRAKTTIFIDNVIIEKVDCPEPFDLNVKNLKPDKATILWSNEFGGKEWEYFVQTPGKGEPTIDGIVTSTIENEITIENETGGALLADTKYEFYVRVNCDDDKKSIWSGPFVFKTECNIINLPFKEGFNSDSKTFVCWTIKDEDKDGITWKTSRAGPFDGDQSMYYFLVSSDTTTINNDWLISPTFKMNGTYRVKYHYKTSSSYGRNEFEVLLSKDGKEIETFKQVLVPNQSYRAINYTEKKIIIHNIVGDINLAWRINGNRTSNIYLDNVIIEEVDNCAEPLDLDVKDILPDKATIVWTDESDSKSWEYFVQQKSKGKPNMKGIITSKKENIVTIDNRTGETLLSNKQYEFYVRTVCNDGKNSIWSGPFIFRTACGTFELPFWEGFNTDSETTRCWTFIDKNDDKRTWMISPYEFFEGNQCAYINSHSPVDSLLVNDDWLISPTLKTYGGMHKIKFNYKADEKLNSEFEILMSTKGDDPKNFTKNILPKQVYKTNYYREKIVFIKDLKGDVNFAWHIINTNRANVKIDNIIIEKVIGCPEPYYTKITGQTDDSVSIEWEQYESGDTWEVIAVPDGEKIPDEKDLNPIIVTKEKKATINGLESGKVYTFYVRVICKDKTHSAWSTGISGATNVKANDNCSGAYNVPVNNGSDCVLFTSGTLLGGSYSEPHKDKCNTWQTTENNVWFEFTATAKTHFISFTDVITPSNIRSGISVALFANDCTVSEAPLKCSYLGKFEKYEDLEIGKKYYLKIYSYDEKADYNFKICITMPPYLYVSPSGEDYTVEELVKNVLVDSNCDLVSNIKYQAGDNSIINTLGYFDKKESSFPYEKGIILSTHAVHEAPGPYKGENSGKLPAWEGDPDLNMVIDQVGGSGFGSRKYVSVLEFDFIPIKDSIKFEYIFASESYRNDCAVVCKPGGALFAAWLTEKETGEGKNLALVPGTQDPIAISTIRDTEKTHAACLSDNPNFFGQYFKDDSSLKVKAPVNYAGITVPMTSEKVGVKVGEKYHIKIAIADFCHNPKHVSAVLFNGGSFDLGKLDLGVDMLVETNNAICNNTEKTIYSGLDKKKGAIKWYKDDVLIPGETDSKLIVNELGNYKVVGKYDFLKCEIEGSIRVEIYPRIEDVISDPEDIVYCANSISGKETTDITINESIILKGLNTEDYQLFYYLTKEDSENDTNAIENPTEFEIPKDKKTQEIFVRVFYEATGCSGYKKFSLLSQKVPEPESPGDQQVCARYIFSELPQGQHYFTKKAAKGKEYRSGDIIDKPGTYTIYICSIKGDCYEEISFNLEITPPVKAKAFKDEIMICENYYLDDLPAGNRYFTQPDAQGDELFVGDTIRLTQTIYVYAKSEQGPNYCIDQSSFEIKFEECPIPKGISPNGDGLNDALDLEVHGVTKIAIYNRYGMEVYSHSRGYTNQWHGQNNSGNQLPDGTYYYVIEARGKTRTGWIQINR